MTGPTPPLRCPVCGTPPVPSARFCFSCGAPLSLPEPGATAERRIVTVLFGDMSDFTAWAEDLDPERVGVVSGRVLAALAQAVTAVGGHVDKLTGDGIMAIFGAPTAHEDDAERAVRAAARMQSAVRRVLEAEVGGGRRLGLRVGLNTGEVLAGVQAALSYTVVGDTVNTASRLSDAAPVGAVYAGAQTAEETRQAASWRPIAPLRLKGKRAPVAAFELIGLRAGSPAAVRLGTGADAPLVGRESALGSLVGRFLECIERAEPTALLVTGDAGVGKTRLIAEFARFAAELPGCRVLWGRCPPYGEGRDLAPIVEWIRTVAGIGEDSEAPVAVERLRRTVDRLRLPAGLPPAVLSDRLLTLLGLAESATGPVDPPAPPGDTAPPGSSLAPADSMLDSVAGLFEVLAGTAPLVLVLDDLQWASGRLLTTIEAMANRLTGPVVLVGAARSARRDPHSGAVADRWLALPRPDVLPLGPLDEATSDRLLTAYLQGAGIDGDVRRLLLTRAQGNPFFLAALLRLVVDRGVVVRDGDRWRRNGDLPGDVLPAGVQAVLAARIDDLAPGVRAVLRDAAVVGSRFSRYALEALGSAPAALLAPALEDLVERGLVVPLEDAGGHSYTFTHRLTRDVAYERLPKAERARRHAAVAAWADGGMPGTPMEVDAFLARHAERAVALATEMALPRRDLAWSAAATGFAALSRLGRAALAREDHAAAERLFTRALELPLEGGAGPDRLRVVVARCAARVQQSRTDGVEPELAPALRSEDPESRAGALLVLGDVRRSRDQLDSAREAYVSALSRAAECGADSLTAQALRHLGLLEYGAGRLAIAEGHFGDALELAERVGDRRGAGWALQHLAWSATSRGGYRTAEGALHHAAEVFTELRDTGALAWCAGTEALVRLLQGRLREARELATALLPVGEALDTRWGVAACRTIVALAAAELGDIDAAIAAADSAGASFAALGDSWGEAMADIARAVAARAGGRPRRAVRHLKRALELSRHGGHPAASALAYALLGYCRLDLGAAGAAETAARKAQSSLAGLDLPPQAAVGISVLLAQALRRQGRLAEALQLLDAAAAAAVEPTLLFPLRQALAHRAGALLEMGNVAAAAVEIRRAMDVPAEDVRSRAVALRVLAAVRIRSGDVDGGRVALDEAMTTALAGGHRTEVRLTETARVALLARSAGPASQPLAVQQEH